MRPCIGHQIGKLLIGAVGVDMHPDPDLAIAWRYRLIEPKQALQVDVALELGGECINPDAASHGVQDEGRRHAASTGAPLLRQDPGLVADQLRERLDHPRTWELLLEDQ